MLNETGLVVTAWKRPDYLHATLSSWAAVPETADLRMIAVALGRSHRFDDMMDVIREAEQGLGRRISVLHDSDAAAVAPGMHRPLGEAIDKLFDSFRVSWAVCGEEDVIVSDDVLRYIAWAQQGREFDDKTLCICAHNKGGAGWDGLAAIREDSSADQCAVRLLPYFNPWVWAVSAGAWRTVIRPVWDWDCNSGGATQSGYDWQLSRLAAQGPWLSVVPDAARSQTIGALSGVYSNPDLLPYQQAHSFLLNRGEVAYRLEDDVDLPAG